MPTRNEFTLHQRQAMETVGGNLLVSAAAGSGKTAVLTERAVLFLTGENPIPADRLIVVTFTVAAAEEMRRRISDRISELLQNDPTNELLQNQQLLLPNAKICTIDSLCANLVKDYAPLLGMSGELKIAEAPELSVMQSQAVGEVLESRYADAQEDFLTLVDYAFSKTDQVLEEMILGIYRYIRSFAFPMDFLDRALQDYDCENPSDSVWGKNICHYLFSTFLYCSELLQDSLKIMKEDPEIFKKYNEAFTNDAVQVATLCQLARDGKLPEMHEYALQMTKLRLQPVRKCVDPELRDALKNRRKKVYDILSDVQAHFLIYSKQDFLDDIHFLKPRIATLFGLVKEVYQKIEEKKRDAGVVDYGDLEYFALQLLLKKTEDGYQKTETAVKISKQYDQIMVDECQDINEVQNMIFTLLSQEQTNLFMVGDVKQSIYRFRKAMPELFIEKKKTFSAYSPENYTKDSKEVITLETNFRSRKEVCDAVNFLFSQIMTEESGDIDYAKGETLVPGVDYPEYSKALPEIHILNYDKEAEEDKTVSEARYIAEMIRDMVSSGYQVTRNNKLCPCSYRDFAVLLRSYKNHAPCYAKAMEEAGIPCFADSDQGYFDSYEVTVILNYLRVIDNPLRDVPLLSVLMSPLYSFSSDQIAEIRLEKSKAPFYRALLLHAQAGDEMSRSFLEDLSVFRQKAAVLPTDLLIQEIYDRTDFPALAGAMANGGEKTANLRLLLNYAQRYLSFGTGGLSGFLRYVDHVMESGADFTAANTLSVSHDAVQILSIHKSKGLEFPICILADLSRRFNRMDLNNGYQLNGKLGFSMRIIDESHLKNYTSFPFEAIRLKNEVENLSEEMRVLYVAATRAKEKLIFVTTIQNAENKLCEAVDQRHGGRALTPFETSSANSFSDWILSAFITHPAFSQIRHTIGRQDLISCDADFPLKAVYVSKLPNTFAPEIQTKLPKANPSPEMMNALQKAIHFSYPFAPMTSLPVKLTVTEIAKHEQEKQTSLSTRPLFLQKQKLTPAQRGTALHSFMQYADYSAAEQDLNKEVSQMVKQCFLTKEEADSLNLPKIQAFFSSSLYRRMKAANNVLREYKFLYFIQAGEVYPEIDPAFFQEKILIQGIADCLFFEPDGIVIVDYKTDYAKEEQVLIDRYYDQLRIYRDAIEKAFSQKVKQCLIYSLHLEKEIEIKM